MMSETFAALDQSFMDYHDRCNRAALNHLLLLVRDFAFQRTRDEDIAQSLVMYLLDNALKINPKRSFSRWLSGAVRNRRTDYYRSIQFKRIYEQSLDEERVRPAKEHAPEFPRDMAALARDLEDGSVERALIESMLDGKTLRQAAEEVGMKESAARNRLRRLGRKLDRAVLDVVAKERAERQGKIYSQKM